MNTSNGYRFTLLALLALLSGAAAAETPTGNTFCGGAIPQSVPSDLEHVVGELTLEAVSQRNGVNGMYCLYGYAAEKCGDHATAQKIFDRCIAGGHAGAMIWKALMFENGNGVPRDLAQAAELYRASAQAGMRGYSTLGKLHYASALWLGKGVARDEAEALKWFRAAADDGDADAKAFLEHGYHTAQRDAQGRGVGRTP